MSDPSGAAPPVATSSQTVGPFFHFGLATSDRLGRIAPDEAAGERISVRLQVLDGDTLPVPDALLEVYQADAEGRYGTPAFPGFGRLATDANGACLFETIRPGAVAAGEAARLDVCLFARGLLRHLYTRVYFDGDPALATDPMLALVPAARRSTLVARLVAPAAWELTIRLQGGDETVFFDL